MAAALSPSAPALAREVVGPEFLYVGTWNNIPAAAAQGHPLGIYGWRLDREKGTLTPIGLVARTVTSADSLAASPDGRFLYATEYNGCICTRSWPFPGAPRAGVVGYAVNPRTGALTPVNRVDGKGDMPAEIRVSPDGRTLALANYYGGNVVTYAIGAGGTLSDAVSDVHHEGTSVHASAGPHPHGLVFSPDNRWLYVADQGLDRVYSYAVDRRTSALTPAATPFLQLASGDGPRQVSVHPNGRWVYAITEQGGTVHLLEAGRDGALRDAQTISVVPEGAALKLGAAQSRVSPDGRFLYVNHRPNENMAVFAIDPRTGRLTLRQFVGTSARVALAPSPAQAPPATPFARKPLWDKVETGARAYAWDASGGWIASANLGENAVVLLRRDAASGTVAETGTAVPAPQPSFVLFLRPR